MFRYVAQPCKARDPLVLGAHVIIAFIDKPKLNFFDKEHYFLHISLSLVQMFPKLTPFLICKHIIMNYGLSLGLRMEQI